MVISRLAINNDLIMMKMMKSLKREFFLRVCAAGKETYLTNHFQVRSAER